MASAVVVALLLVVCAICSLILSPEQVANSLTLSCFVYLLYLSLFVFLVGGIIKVLQLAPAIRRYPIALFWGVVACLFVVRYVAIQWQRPSLFFSTAFFTSPAAALPGMYAQNMGTLFTDVCQLMALATIGLKYFASLRRSFMNRRRWLAGAQLTLDLFIILGLFFFIPYVMGGIFSAGTIELNPSHLLSFNIYSIMAIFVLFGLAYSSAMGVNKILRVLHYYWKRKVIRLCLHVATCYVILSVLLTHSRPSLAGYPTWICAVFLFIFLIVSIAWGRSERNNYRFFPVVSKLVVFSLFMALMTNYFVKEHVAKVREQLVTDLAASVDSFAENPPLDVVSLFDSVYPKKVLHIAHAWVVKTPKFINRTVLTNYARDAAQYSLAYYEKGRLIDQYGGYHYRLNSKYYTDFQKNKFYKGGILLEGHTHYLYPLKQGDLIVVSMKSNSHLDFMVAFSLFFILFLIFYVLILFLCWATVGIRWTLSFYNTLLWSALVLMLVTGLIVGLLSISAADRRVYNDRMGMVQVKMGIIEGDLIRNYGLFLGDEKGETTVHRVDSSLRALSSSFCLDLKFFNSDGRLLYSSGSEPGMEENRIPGNVLKQMQKGHSYWSEVRLINYMNVIEVYKVILDADGKTVGYFSASDVRNRYAFDEKLATMVTRCLIIYSWLIIFAILGAVLIFIIGTSSMRKLGRAMRDRSHPFSPIRLEWEVNEEIGQLISEHNNMVETLRFNAIQMAKSERETAWREMAQEIAHEVKNPLTPMRLKMQMLQRSWLSDKPDLESRFNEATEEVLRQIDVLSEVADTFSEFAATQLSFNHDVDLKGILTELADELSPNLTTTYNFQLIPETECYAFVDRKQFKQMVYNLVKNADHNRLDNGRLDISIRLEDAEGADAWLLTFHSNDRGLDLADEALVFTVKFSADNCGHSLCLPIVRNIVAGFGGEISFRTAPDYGTTFYVKIPKL